MSLLSNLNNNLNLVTVSKNNKICIPNQYHIFFCTYIIFWYSLHIQVCVEECHCLYCSSIFGSFRLVSTNISCRNLCEKCEMKPVPNYLGLSVSLSLSCDKTIISSFSKQFLRVIILYYFMKSYLLKTYFKKKIPLQFK